MPKLKQVSPEKLKEFKVKSTQQINQQVYQSEPKPDGVEVIKAQIFYDDNGGHFLELARFNEGIVASLKEKGVTLDILNGQVNASVIAPGTERLGHLHPQQDEVWVVASGTLVMGVVDLREGSPTEGVKARFVLSPGTGVYVPHGVAHSLGNYGVDKALLNYVASMQFSPGEDTQEWRCIPEDSDFWNFMRPEKV